MAVIVVLLFCVFVFFYVGKGSIARFLSLIIFMSLLCYCFVSRFNFSHSEHLLHAIWVIITIGAIVLPWKRYKHIIVITGEQDKKIDNVANVLITICLLLDIVCLIISYFVITLVGDINSFKYTDGTQDFYGSLGIDLHGLTLAVLLYPLGYVLIPFVFYYLSQNRNKKALLCFFGSLLPVLYGLTYYSRAHMVHFALSYLAAYLLLKNTISPSVEKKIRMGLVILGLVFAIGFVVISSNRFDDKYYETSSGEIETENASLVSSLDYISMWWPNSELIFERFNGETFKNEILFNQIHQFFYITTFGRIKDNSQIIANDRERLLREKSNSFIGVSGYTLYDQGPVLGIILYLVYGLLVRYIRPKNGRISIVSLMLVFILIQYPLYSIFYSIMPSIVLTLMLMIPFLFYLGLKRIKN